MLISLINISIFKPLKDFNGQISQKITWALVGCGLGVGWVWVGCGLGVGWVWVEILVYHVIIYQFKPLEDFNGQFSQKITKDYLGMSWAWVEYHANISDKYINSNCWILNLG